MQVGATGAIRAIGRDVLVARTLPVASTTIREQWPAMPQRQERPAPCSIEVLGAGPDGAVGANASTNIVPIGADSNVVASRTPRVQLGRIETDERAGPESWFGRKCDARVLLR